jgi:hypothetical protein
VFGLTQEVAESDRAWDDDDLESAPWSRDLVGKDAAWILLCAGAENRLRALVAGDALEAKGRGKDLRVPRVSFDHWLGQPVTVYPAWAARHEVRPTPTSASRQTPHAGATRGGTDAHALRPRGR